MFEVGEVVYEVRGFSEKLYKREVSRIVKSFVELDDGSKWHPETGYPYPRRSYDRSRLLKETEKTMAGWRRDHAMRTIDRTKWGEVDLEVLIAIAALLQREEQP